MPDDSPRRSDRRIERPIDPAAPHDAHYCVPGWCGGKPGDGMHYPPPGGESFLTTPRRNTYPAMPTELWVDGQRWQAPDDGVGKWHLAPVEYAPSITYRGKILWHHLSDAMDIAVTVSTYRGYRHRVKPKRVPGHDHLLWRVVPTTQPLSAQALRW